MPAIQAEACLRNIYAIRTDHLAQTGIGRRKGLIPMGLRIFKIIRAAEIILRARAADGGIFPVAIHVELDLSLAPPAGVVHAPGHVGADILPSPANSIQNRIILLIGQRIDPAELRILPPAAGKEITQRTLHGGNIAAVPIDAKDLAAPIAGGREPDMADHAAALAVPSASGVRAPIPLPPVRFSGQMERSDREEDAIDSCCSSVKPPFASFVGSAPTYPFHRPVSTRKGLDFFNELTYHKIR